MDQIKFMEDSPYKNLKWYYGLFKPTTHDTSIFKYMVPYDACNAQHEYDLKCFSEIQESVLHGLMISSNATLLALGWQLKDAAIKFQQIFL